MTRMTRMTRMTLPLAIACLLVAACDSAKEEAPTVELKAAVAEAEAAVAEVEAKAAVAKAEAKKEGARARVGKAVENVKAAKKARAEAGAKKAKENYGGEFCATIIPCFEKMKFAGNLMAGVSVDIEPDGHVSAVSITGDAPKPVQSCITDTIKGITLAEYNGKAGRTRCTKSGQLVGGTQMIMSDSSYELRD